jgi:HAD superfamily hydrolase (TIGR01509 family)
MMTVSEIIRRATAVLLDFDGPVCGLFSGYPAPVVADEIRQFLRVRSTGEQGPEDAAAGPHDLLHWTATNRPDLVNEVEDMLRAAERKAARTAAPTAGSRDAILAASRAGRPVAIVSNNARESVVDYLDREGLARYVSYVSGRPYAEPHRMKPAPESLLRTVEILGESPEKCVFVGDSITDAEASRRAGVPFVGYAKGPDRTPVLIEAGSQVVVESMRDIADALESA